MLSSSPPPLRSWRLPDRIWEPTSLPRLMAILNVTPDSFSDGGCHDAPEAAVEQGLKLVADGADVLDIGGESTRPGADVVPVDEELRRVLPVITALARQTDVPLSIDTTKAAVARAAIDAGATIVNDISGLTFDDQMPSVCAESKVAVVCMHIQGTPQTMQDEPVYDDVLHDIRTFLQSRLEFLQAAGISPECVCLDPGIGFGKTAEHNVTLLASVRALQQSGRPLLIGHSRKRFLGRVLGRRVEERLAGTLGVSIALAAQGADLLRVHDVQAVRDALLAWHAITAATAE